MKEIRATNQEETYLQGLYQKIDTHEKVMIKGELVAGLFVNGASVIMRLGVATTILVGVHLIVQGQVDFMILFMFLLVITRIYAPFDQSLALIAEMFVSQVSATRITEIYDTPVASGEKTFKPKGYDIEFHHVSFAYDLQEYIQARDFFYPYEEYTYGPVVKNQKELEKAILNPNDYSQKKEKFQKKFMSSCDGKSTKRFVEQLLGGKS